MLSVYSVSLGCPKNRVDTEHLIGSLGVAIRPVEAVEDAELVVINTCGFILPAVEESVRTILETVEDVSEMGGKRPFVVVAGCLVGRYGEKELAPELPEVDLWLPNQEIEAWPQMLAQKLGLPVPKELGRILSTGPSYAWLKVSDGCRHNCSFCTIPMIRGPHRSTEAGILVKEAEGLIDQGVKEIILVAQDVTAWGEDIGAKHGLATLLDRLLPLKGLERLRLLYLYPAGLTENLLKYMRDAGGPLVPYFDIPTQHAHSDILSRMGRPFARDPRKVIDRVRNVFPEAALRTSLIVGFPGETEDHYQTLTDFVEETRFTHLGVFAYKAEDGTPAAAMPDQVQDEVKEWRRDALMELQGEISEEIMESYLGSRQKILVDAPHEEWPGLYTGRTWFQAPEIDGMTYISGPNVEAGKMIEADIMEARTYDLVALE